MPCSRSPWLSRRRSASVAGSARYGASRALCGALSTTSCVGRRSAVRQCDGSRTRGCHDQSKGLCTVSMTGSSSRVKTSPAEADSTVPSAAYAVPIPPGARRTTARRPSERTRSAACRKRRPCREPYRRRSRSWIPASFAGCWSCTVKPGAGHTGLPAPQGSVAPYMGSRTPPHQCLQGPWWVAPE